MDGLHCQRQGKEEIGELKLTKNVEISLCHEHQSTGVHAVIITLLSCYYHVIFMLSSRYDHVIIALLYVRDLKL